MNNPHAITPLKPVKGQPVYDRNPSLPDKTEIAKPRKTKMGNDKRGLVINTETGEVVGGGGASFYDFEEVDKERFVKLYLAGLKNAVGLSKAGMVVFQAVYDHMRENPNTDTLGLAPQFLGMSQPQFSRGLRELLEREFLYRHPVPNQYWVNIRYMFNGDRLAFVKGYKLKPDPKQLDMFTAAGSEIDN